MGGTESVLCTLTSVYGGRTINIYALGSGLAFLAAPLSYIAKTLLVQIVVGGGFDGEYGLGNEDYKFHR